jgi:hypothetical protein
MCVDYYGLNQLNNKNQYHLLLISKLLYHLNHTKVYNKIDVHGAIWCMFKKAMNGKQHSKHVMAILNMLWCILTLQMHL